MSSKRRYKCLNFARCKAYTGGTASGVFVAMNRPQPSCPWCGSIKLEDWGEAVMPMVSTSGELQRVEKGLREIADVYGMTNITNEGKRVKNTGAKGDFGYKTIAPGVTVPVDHNPTCERVGLSSKLKVKPGENARARPAANVVPSYGASS